MEKIYARCVTKIQTYLYTSRIIGALDIRIGQIMVGRSTSYAEYKILNTRKIRVLVTLMIDISYN